MRKLRANQRLEYFITATMVAFEAGELTEMQAAKLMNMDAIALRDLRRDLIEMAAKNWAQYRAENPPQEK